MAKYHVKKPFKYEMTKRKEAWKSISRPLEKQYVTPIEQQPSVIKGLVSATCYKQLVSLLDLPPVDDSHDSVNYDDSNSPITSAEDIPTGLVPDEGASVLKSSVQNGKSRSSELSSQFSEGVEYDSQVSKTTIEPLLRKPGTVESSKQYEAFSNFVEVDKNIPNDTAKMMKHKAILRFLCLPHSEVASWRTVEIKGVGELSEMTLEQQGDFLMNKIAADFCEWMKKLGGDEKSFINEEILKELFEMCMDNHASRAICIKTREKRVLYYKLAEYLQEPEKSFQAALSSHLNWNAKVEKLPSKLTAFHKALPKDLQFKTPKNRTSEKWLEWNNLSPDQPIFADVYSSIKDLRSTKEYCKWLLNHPEHKKPQYLVDQGLFEPAQLEMERKQNEAAHSLRFASSATTDLSVMSTTRD